MSSADNMNGASARDPPGGTTTTPVATNTQHSEIAASSVARCVCGWKNCRAYQKAFRDAKHPTWDGVIKLKFATDHAESMALKQSIDRNLKVPAERASDWKNGKRGDQQVIRYTIARHHFTEKHILKYLADPKNYSFLKPFSVHGAKKYLHTVDQAETVGGASSSDGQEVLYLQCPNVPKEAVKAEFLKVKEAMDSKRTSASNHNRSSPAKNKSSSSKKEVGDRKQPRASASVRSKEPSAAAAPAPVVQPDPSTMVALKAKEDENKHLKDQLESMKSQLTFLHDMVRRLQEEHFDHVSVRSGRSRASRAQPQTNNNPNSTSSRRSYVGAQSMRSSRSGVPQEIELGDDGKNRDRGHGGNNEWSEMAEDWTDADADPYDDDDDDDDEEPTDTQDEDDATHGTFQVTYKAQRRDSNESRMSKGASTIVSASKSVKTLPREIELDEDEDDSASHESLEDEAFDARSYDARSFASTNQHGYGGGSSEHSRTSGLGPPSPMRADKSARSMQPNSKKPHRSPSSGSVASAKSGRSARSGRSRSKHRRRTSGDGTAETDETSGGGVYRVEAMLVTDPYGEQGTYTGTISNATGMPHGRGRLEYDRAGRWYEGDWKHGRWTGRGQLSNGDGDYYEGGLKNDHKHGIGKMVFADGRTFEGEYVNGQMIEGKMTYQDGSTYEGSWVDGMRHGHGRCVFTDRSIYEGEFREGEFYGHGKMAWSDGGHYIGEWWNGEMHGRGKEVRPDGSLRHDGQWSKGQPIRNK